MATAAVLSADASQPVRTLAAANVNGGQRSITTGFADPAFMSADADLRTEVFGAAQRADASIARLIVGWGSVAKAEPIAPTDPADPAYDWSQLDRGVVEAGGHGMEVLMTIHRAPEWAEGPDRPYRLIAPAGTWRPNAAALGDFAQALARRYDGTYTPVGATGPLPRVQFFEPWNEPNLSGFLTPQWDGRRQVSAQIYRGLLNAVYDGVKISQPDATVIAGATGPEGDPAGGRRTKPMRFLRELLCLGAGRRPDPKLCPSPASFDVLSHHPISPSQSPRRPAVPGDVSFQEMPDLRRILRVAEGYGTVEPAGLRRELWATELWWESVPPVRRADYPAPGERLQARYLADALRILWEKHVPVGLLFQVRDSPEVSHRPRIGWGTGVEFADGEPKRAARAIRFPFAADRVSRQRVTVWLRSPAEGRLRIVLRRTNGKSATLVRGHVAAGEVVSQRTRLRGGGRLQAWLGDRRSLSWRIENRGRR